MTARGSIRRAAAMAALACLVTLPGLDPRPDRAVAQTIFNFNNLAGPTAAQSNAPSVEDYMRDNPHAKFMGAGGFVIDGNRLYCGRRPVIVDDKFDSWGGAFPGFLIWNNAMTEKLPTVVKLYIFSHECGHQFVGRDEKAADCFAMRRGRRYGWLNDAGMEQICGFIGHLRADDEHAGGSDRCAYMRQCYADHALDKK